MGENGLTINQSRQDELLNQYNLNLQRPPPKKKSIIQISNLDWKSY